LHKLKVPVNQLRQYPITQLKKLMKISDLLATLTLERYAGWHRPLKAGEGTEESSGTLAAIGDSGGNIPQCTFPHTIPKVH
jgi:hypothetical protein